MKKTTIERLHAMTPAARRRWFARASEDEILAVTNPCPGAAHENPHVDTCGVCLGAAWGRALRPLVVTVEIPEALYREIAALADTPRTGVPVRHWIRMLLREGVEDERRRKAMVASLGGAAALARAILGR